MGRGIARDSARDSARRHIGAAKSVDKGASAPNAVTMASMDMVVSGPAAICSVATPEKAAEPVAGIAGSFSGFCIAAFVSVAVPSV